MALYNEILAGRFNRALQKLLGLKGKTGAPQLAGEIMPVIPHFFGAEGRYLEGWNRYMRATSVAAVAGNNSALQIRNPLGSNVVVVVEKLNFTVDVNGLSGLNIYLITTNIGDLTTLFTPNRLDARSATSGAIASLSGQTAAAVTGIQLFILSNQANTLIDVILTDDQELTLLPGDAIRIISGINTNLVANFQWRERFLEDSERA